MVRVHLDDHIWFRLLDVLAHLSEHRFGFQRFVGVLNLLDQSGRMGHSGGENYFAMITCRISEWFESDVSRCSEASPR